MIHGWPTQLVVWEPKAQVLSLQNRNSHHNTRSPVKRDIVTRQGDFHYITFSTYGRRSLLSTPLARQIVISVLGRLVRGGKVRVSGFVIMHDHVHAILWFGDDTELPGVLQTWKSMSANYLRKHYEQTMPGMIHHLRTQRSGRDVVCFWQRRYYDFKSTHRRSSMRN